MAWFCVRDGFASKDLFSPAIKKTLMFLAKINKLEDEIHKTVIFISGLKHCESMSTKKPLFSVLISTKMCHGLAMASGHRDGQSGEAEEERRNLGLLSF